MIRKKVTIFFSLFILSGFSTPPGPFVGGAASERAQLTMHQQLLSGQGLPQQPWEHLLTRNSERKYWSREILNC